MLCALRDGKICSQGRTGRPHMAEVIRAICPHCGVMTNIRQSSLGVLRKCPGCNGKIVFHLDEQRTGCLASFWRAVKLLVLFAVLALIAIFAVVAWTMRDFKG